MLAYLPQKIDIQLHEEFSHIQTWADNNGMIINISKTKEIVFHRPLSLSCLNP